ncbi:MAG: hypothetical protein ABF714_10335, partial [Novacetimonas hansenii]|uniref:hypothetical protein n=1 Tax=Novacetimonas hansenii TaxID=436 RepID=UPI0039EBBDFB
KSFRRRRLFKKRRHPNTFIIFINELFSNNLVENQVTPKTILEFSCRDRDTCRAQAAPGYRKLAVSRN